MMKGYWTKIRSKFYKILILILALLAVEFILIGYSIDGKEFTGNLLAEAVGLILGVVVTLFIVDRYSMARELQQWAKIRETIYSALAYNLGKLFASSVFTFENEYGEYELKLVNQVLIPSDETLGAMRILVSRMMDIEQEILTGDDEEREKKAKKFYESITKFDELIQPGVEQIRNILIPRMLLYSKDQTLIELVISLDQILFFGYDLIEQIVILTTRGVSPEIIHEGYGNWVSKLLGKTFDVYLELCNVWEP